MTQSDPDERTSRFFHSRSRPPDQEPNQSQSNGPSHHASALPAAPGGPKASQQGNRLAVLIFLATFLGTLLGVVADLADASNLVAPILETFSPSPQLRIVGSDTILGEDLGMAARWREDFQTQESWEVPLPLVGSVPRTVNIQIEAIGTGNGVREAVEGKKVDILAASEPLTDERINDLQSKGISIVCAAEIGYDVIAFVTDFNNRAPRVSSEDMSKILAGQYRNWFAVGGDSQPVRILARLGSGTTDVVLENFTGSTQWPAYFIPCGTPAGHPACAQDPNLKNIPSNCDGPGGNQACLDLTLRIPGSLYWVSSAWMRTQPTRYLALVPTRPGPNAPESDNPIQPGFNPDNYPRELVRPLYLYVLSGGAMDAESTAYARKFLRYVRSVHGQEVLETGRAQAQDEAAGQVNYFYNFFNPPGSPGEIKLKLPPPFDQADGNGMRPDCIQ